MHGDSLGLEIYFDTHLRSQQLYDGLLRIELNESPKLELNF